MSMRTMTLVMRKILEIQWEMFPKNGKNCLSTLICELMMNCRYNEYKHQGYDWDGNPILKPETGDHLDEFLKRMEDPDFWRTVKDPQTGQNVILSDEDINLIKRIKAQKIPDVSFDEYAPWIEW